MPGSTCHVLLGRLSPAGQPHFESPRAGGSRRGEPEERTVRQAGGPQSGCRHRVQRLPWAEGGGGEGSDFLARDGCWAWACVITEAGWDNEVSVETQESSGAQDLTQSLSWVILSWRRQSGSASEATWVAGPMGFGSSEDSCRLASSADSWSPNPQGQHWSIQGQSPGLRIPIRP
jgi:hypothetical protein